MITVLTMLSICTILLVICYLVKFFLFSVRYYQIDEIKLYIGYIDSTYVRVTVSICITRCT